MTNSQQEFDPVFVHSKRESIVLVVTFTTFLIWCIAASWRLGYGQPEGTPLRMIWGVPSWVFWSVALPWLVANLFTLAFSLFYVADDPLGKALDELDREAPADEETEA